MHNSTAHSTPRYSSRESSFLMVSDVLTELSVYEIDKQIEAFEYIEDEDIDYIPFKDECVELEYYDLRLYIDIELRNESISIIGVTALDSDDIECKLVGDRIYRDLTKYYDKQNIQISATYKQTVEIKHDQNDPYNLSPAMPKWQEAMNQHAETVISLCRKRPTEKELKNLFQFGSAGRQFILKNGISDNRLIETFMPLIDEGLFPQRDKDSSAVDKARFIVANFEGLKVPNLQKRISDYIPPN